MLRRNVKNLLSFIISFVFMFAFSVKTLALSSIVNRDGYPDNCLIINDKIISIVIDEPTQKNVDRYDVVQDNSYFSTDNDIFCFGHNTRSFKILNKVKVDSTITLINDGISQDYIVLRSELGYTNNAETDIISCDDQQLLVSHDYECETLRLITCASKFGRNYRWVVTCYKAQ